MQLSSKTQTLHILGGRSVYFCRGRSKRGSAPQQQTLENAPLSFTSQPNLNLTMEPAHYACNPTHDPGSADQPEYLLSAFKKRKKKGVSLSDRIAHEWVWWMFSVLLAEVNHVSHMESQPGGK